MNRWTEGQIYHQGYRIGMTYEESSGQGDEHEQNEAAAAFRLLILREGTGLVQVQDRLYPVLAPGVYCLQAGDQAQFMMQSSFPMKLLHFHPSVLNERLEALLNGSGEGGTSDHQDLWALEPFTDRTAWYYGAIPLDPAVVKHVEDRMEAIGRNLTQQPDQYWPCRSRSYLMELLFLIRQAYQETEVTSHSIPESVSGAVKSVVAYLHTHYHEKIRLEHLTNHFHINKTTLNETFRRATGFSVIAYLNHLRMRMADSMLRNTTLPTTEIMARIGIQDDAHFIRHFRKHSGYSPAEYRNKYCWMLHRS